MTIEIKDSEALEKMRIVGALAARQLEMIEEHIKPGISTGELDRICHAYTINEQDAIPAPLNYRGFPKSICTSVNHVVCHGIPSDDKVLKSGDIVNVDVTLIKDGYHGDTSKTFIVGTAGVLAERLTQVCKESLYLGIQAVKPGAHLGDIGAAIQIYVEKNRFSIVREYCGHGIGQVFHEDRSTHAQSNTCSFRRIVRWHSQYRPNECQDGPFRYRYTCSRRRPVKRVWRE